MTNKVESTDLKIVTKDSKIAFWKMGSLHIQIIMLSYMKINFTVLLTSI